jgi:4-coumarate--CoA ligase
MYPLAAFAVIGAGGIFSTTGPNIEPTGAAYQFKTAHAKVVFCSEDLMGNTRTACTLAGIPHSKIYIVTSSPKHDIINAESGDSLISQSVLAWEKITDPAILESTTIIINFTSGTSGMPKLDIA